MRGRIAHRILVVALLLAAGLALALLRPGPQAESPSLLPRTIWFARRADLAIQLALMLVGALGIRALLPGEGDEDPYESEEVLDESAD